MSFDRACGDEEALGDLAVGESLAREFGDAALAGGQRVESREDDPARARAGGAECGLGSVGEWLGARAVGRIQRLAEQLASVGAAVAPPEHRAEVGKCASSFQPRVATREVVDGLTEQELATLPTGHDAGGTLRNAERARGAECLGELEFLVCQSCHQSATTET